MGDHIFLVLANGWLAVALFFPQHQWIGYGLAALFTILQVLNYLVNLPQDP